MAHLPYFSWGHPASQTSERLHISASEAFLHSNPRSIAMAMSTEMDHVPFYQTHKYGPVFSGSPRYRLIFIALPLSAVLSTPSMVTRKKNKSAHPGLPDMTPSQRASAGLSHARGARSSNKKPTKDQQISALNDEVQELRELILSVCYFSLCRPYSLCSHLFPSSVPTSMQHVVKTHKFYLTQAVIRTPQLILTNPLWQA